MKSTKKAPLKSSFRSCKKTFKKVKRHFWVFFHWTRIGLYLRTTDKLVYKSYAKISASNDNSTILKQLLIVWERLIAQHKVDSFHQVAISLSGLTEKPRQLTFDDLGTINKNRELSVAMDNINNKYAQTIISFGMPPAIKDEPIAFSHIPGANVKEYLN